METAKKVNSLNDLNPNTENPKYLCHFKEDGWIFDYYAFLRGRNKLLVQYPGAIADIKKRAKIIPNFPRWTWASKLNSYDILNVADPTVRLDDTLFGGYFMGKFDDYILLRHIKHLQFLVDKNKYETVIFHGSSLGGFISLQMAILFPPPLNKLVLAEIPQISLIKFTAARNNMNHLAKLCYNVNGILNVPNKYLYRLDIVELMKKYNYVPNGLVVIKESDSHHYNVHIKYLMDNITAQQRNNLKIEVIPSSIDKSGHTALNLDQFKERLEYLDIMTNMYKDYDKYYY